MVAFLDLDQELLAPRFRAAAQAHWLTTRGAQLLAGSPRERTRLLVQTRQPEHEVVQALAPGSTIKVYEAPNSDAGETAVYSKLVSDDVPIVSISWGIYESGETSSNRTALNTEKSYVRCVHHYARFLQGPQPKPLLTTEAKIEAFLTKLALQGVAAS